jgi:hypothetical protein
MAENISDNGRDGAHIWLRYTTQYTQQGRTHTFEIGIPVPLGASAEMRENLIEEAEAGMEQLSTHVENRIARLLQRNQRATTPAIAVPTTTPPVSGTPNVSRQTSQPVQASKATPSAPTAATQTQNKAAAPTRTTGPGGENENTLRTKFIMRVKENLGLTPPQIMEQLNVKSLSGFDFQEAYERLKQLAGQKSPASDPPVPATSAPRPARSEVEQQARSTTVTPASQAHQAPPPARTRPAAEGPVVAENRPPLRFEEEDDLPDLDDIDFEEEDEDEEPPEPYMAELAGAGKERARGRIERLRAVKSTMKAGADRMRVLINITDTQISNEQLRQLFRDIWGLANPKTAKSEQVEALISWAKEDAFVEEVEAVLALIEEEGLDAGSNR